MKGSVRRGATVAAAIVTVVAGAPLAGILLPASASAAGSGFVVTAAQQDVVLAGDSSAQPAGDWAVGVPQGSGQASSTASPTELDIFIAAADSTDPSTTSGTTAPTCDIGFASPPTVKQTSTTNDMSLVVGGVLATSPGCRKVAQAVPSTPVTDELRIALTDPAGTNLADTVGVTGVQYMVATASYPGPIKLYYTVECGSNATCSPLVPASPGVGAFGDSNTRVQDAILSANSPPTGVVPGTDQGVGDITVAETATGSLRTGLTVCVQITTTGVSFAGTPTVANSGGATPGTPAVVGNVLSFPITKAATTGPSSFVVSGVALSSTKATGLVRVQAGVPKTSGGGCTDDDDPGTPLVAGTVVNAARYAGATRDDTAAAVFDASFGCNPATGGNTNGQSAILARDDNFPDALSGSYLAGSLHTGVLLTATDSIPASTLNAFAATGVHTVYLLGGIAAISDQAASQLTSTQATTCSTTQPGTVFKATTSTGAPLDLQVVRIAGADRYQTAKMVAETPATSSVGTLLVAVPGASTSVSPTAIVASGLSFPDALSAAPMAWAGTHGTNGNGHGFPLLLTDPTSLSADTQQALTDLGIHQVLIPGGSAAVSDAVAGQLQQAGIDVLRFAGADRTDTAAKVAAFEVGGGASAGPQGLFFSDTSLMLARGDTFPDALAAGPRGGLTTSPLLFGADTTTLGPYTTAYLQGTAKASATGVTGLAVMGGTDAVSDAVVSSALGDLTGA